MKNSINRVILSICSQKFDSLLASVKFIVSFSLFQFGEFGSGVLFSLEGYLNNPPPAETLLLKNLSSSADSTLYRHESEITDESRIIYIQHFI